MPLTVRNVGLIAAVTLLTMLSVNLSASRSPLIRRIVLGNNGLRAAGAPTTREA